MADLVTAVSSGDYRAALEAVRDELALAFDEASAGVKPQVASQLRAVLADINALPSAPVAQPAGVVTLGDAKAKREARIAAAIGKSAAEVAPRAKAGGRKRG